MENLRKISCIFFMLLGASMVNAQEEKLHLGLKLSQEVTGLHSFLPGGGIQLIKRIKTHSGWESGLYYRNQVDRFDYFIEVNNSIIYQEVVLHERRLQIPFLFRFDSRIINFNVGPGVEYFVGWKQKKGKPLVMVTEYDRKGLVFFATTGISKSLSLTPNLVLEPELNLQVSFDGDPVGFLFFSIVVRKLDLFKKQSK